jgi:hypothetical protein
MAAIAFIGDSFCAGIDMQEWVRYGKRRWQFGSELPSWPSLVATKLNLSPYYHGYCGKSWWYSRHWFFQRCKKILADNQFEVIVFCHTDSTRINHLSELLINEMVPATVEEKILKNAQDLWRVYLNDETFAHWCQYNWLLEIKNTFQHVPRIIQFTCFDPDLFDNFNRSGMCFKTPLFEIQKKEHTGTHEEQIKKALDIGYQPNHFNTLNNFAMSDLIIDAVNNYNPGLHKIDLSKFNLQH